MSFSRTPGPEASSATAPAPRLHFAMLTYGALFATKRCVRSLRATTNMPFDLWVVDNASTDGTPAWLQAQREPWLHHRLNRTNRGVPGGRNDLLDFVLPQCAPQDWLVFIDNDLEFRPGWLAAFVAALAKFPRARVIGKAGHFMQVHGDSRTLLPASITTGHVDVVSGGFACFVRADAARAIGRFDERLGLFWHEDDDYCVRAMQQGFDVVAVPEADIVHHEHASGVAEAGLAAGGSPQNLAYLIDKWRSAGWIDRDGWIVRQHGPYAPPQVRDELRRRLGRQGAIGRTELAACLQLLEHVLEQPDVAVWLDRHRRPIPACTQALLALHREQAERLGQTELVARLAVVAAGLEQARNLTALKTMVRTLGTPSAAPSGSGICRDSDFDCDEFLRVADAIGLGMLARDPYARSSVNWEDIATVLQLERAGCLRRGARVLCVGEPAAVVARHLRAKGVEVLIDERAKSATGCCDGILFSRVLDTDQIIETLTAHADADTLVVLVGDVGLNGVPLKQAPQPHQLELDLLARTRMRPVAPLGVLAEDAVLEACAPSSESKQTPRLSWLAGPRVCSAFVVGARPVHPVARPGVLAQTDVLLPAVPRAKATMRVGVDMRTLFLADSIARGIGKYTVQHLAALCDLEPGLRLVGYTQQDRVELPNALRRPEVTTRSLDDYRPDQVDLMHIPDPMNMSFGFDSPLRVLRHERTTITFHDLTPLHLYIENWPRPNREGYLDRLRQIERSSCHLLANSEFTAADALRHLRIEPARTTPILAGLHHDGGSPPDAAVIADVHAQLGIRGPFVLHVGALDPHKNFHTALNAFLLARAHQPLQLLVVGAIDPGTTEAAVMCTQLKVHDVTFTGYLPRRHLDALYSSAVALLFLSRAEGFGLPILEAMAKGCPVIASDATSHPEVAGTAGMLVAPGDQAAAAHGIRQLLQDPTLADEMRRRGYAQAERFPWRAVAERTLARWRAMLAAGMLPKGMLTTSMLTTSTAEPVRPVASA